MTGIICINKPQEFTSFDVVAVMRRCFGTKKVGHGGTLDPMATGVLPVFVGGATKAVDIIPDTDKSYRGAFRLGLTSDTQDIWGEVTSVTDRRVSAEELSSVLERFRGDIMQVPPMYSALKVNGQKLCDLARQGIEVEREARPITISRLEVTEFDGTDGVIEVDCSSGTYIRTLCADIGKKLNTGGVMSSLTRTEASGFSLEDAITLEELENITAEERWERVLPVERVFEKFGKIHLEPFYARLAKSGCEIYQSKIKTSHPVDKFITMWDKNGFFALGQVRQYENGTAIKAIKLFVI